MTAAYINIQNGHFFQSVSFEIRVSSLLNCLVFGALTEEGKSTNGNLAPCFYAFSCTNQQSIAIAKIADGLLAKIAENLSILRLIGGRYGL